MDDKLKQWYGKNFETPPDPPPTNLSDIMTISYQEVGGKPIGWIEGCIFALTSHLHYVSFQTAITANEARLKEQRVEDATVAESRKFSRDGTLGYKERLSMARCQNEELMRHWNELQELKGKADMIRELKFSIKDRLDALRAIYFRKRGR